MRNAMTVAAPSWYHPPPSWYRAHAFRHDKIHPARSKWSTEPSYEIITLANICSYSTRTNSLPVSCWRFYIQSPLQWRKTKGALEFAQVRCTLHRWCIKILSNRTTLKSLETCKPFLGGPRMELPSTWCCKRQHVWKTIYTMWGAMLSQHIWCRAWQAHYLVTLQCPFNCGGRHTSSYFVHFLAPFGRQAQYLIQLQCPVAW